MIQYYAAIGCKMVKKRGSEESIASIEKDGTEGPN